MRTFRHILVLLLAVASSVSLSGQCFPVHPDLAEEHAFRQDERLTYIIHYKWLGIRTDVGSAEVTLHDGGERDGRHLLHPVATGSTYRFWDVFFKVRDTYESVFYEDSVRPVYFHRDIHEGKYKEHLQLGRQHARHSCPNRVGQAVAGHAAPGARVYIRHPDPVLQCPQYGLRGIGAGRQQSRLFRHRRGDIRYIFPLYRQGGEARAGARGLQDDEVRGQGGGRGGVYGRAGDVYLGLG